MTEARVPPGVSVRRDLVHTRVPGYRPLSLDLYLPDAPARAICVYVHGGGWRMGSRREGPGPLSPTSARLFARLAGHGLAVASVDYRLSGEARFPAQLEDVRAACAWLTADVLPELSALPLTVFGVSAGGQLAALCALQADLGVTAAALWYPVTDFLALPADIAAAGGDADPGPTSREALLLGAPAAAVPELARQASPLGQVHAQAPPFLLVHGTADVLVPPVQSARLRDALVALDVPTRLVELPGHQHMLTGLAADELEDLVDRTAAFLLAPLAATA